MNYIDRFSANVEHGYYYTKDYIDGDRERLRGVRKSFSSACTLEVTACTNGYHGGDSGHGSRTVIGFRDLGGTDIKVVPIPPVSGNGGCELHLGGDCELAILIDALRFAADSLEKLAEEAQDSQGD